MWCGWRSRTFWLVVYSSQYEFPTSQSQADTLYGNPPGALKPAYCHSGIKKRQFFYPTLLLSSPFLAVASFYTLSTIKLAKRGYQSNQGGEPIGGFVPCISHIRSLRILWQSQMCPLIVKKKIVLSTWQVFWLGIWSRFDVICETFWLNRKTACSYVRPIYESKDLSLMCSPFCKAGE